MDRSTPPPIAIDYATPAARRPPAELGREMSRWLSRVSAAGVLAIAIVFLAAGATASPSLAIVAVLLAIFWLPFAASLAVVALLEGVGYATQSLRRGFPPPATPRRAARRRRWRGRSRGSG